MKYRVFKAYIPIIFSIISLVVVIAFSYTFSILGLSSTQKTPIVHSNSKIIEKDENVTPVNGTYFSSKGEMLAVWVPFMTLSIENNNHTKETFEKHFNGIVETAKKCGMNTLVVHIRPYGDALYPSKYFPTSHILTGTQGEHIDYDPLKYMVDACHSANLEFHAWINPYRIKVSNTPNELSKDNPYYTLKDSNEKISPILTWEKDIFYNPASATARELIINGVKEIVKNYAIDGIQFDDYFYPTSNSDYDKESYNSYLNTIEKENIPLTLTTWRSYQVNTLIAGVYSAIHSISDNVDFGIAPQGNIENDINMGADVYSWCNTNGYIDYICPQIYYNFENPLLPYDKSINQWKNIVTATNVKLYVGLGVYKAGSDEDDGTWKSSDDILKSQIEYGRQNGIKGFMLYSWEYLNNNQTEKEIENVMKIL